MSQPYDQSVDMWSLGILAFVILGGQLPFFGEDDKAVARAVVRGKYSFSGARWSGISAAARSFIGALIVHKASDRLSAHAASLQPWLQAEDESGESDGASFFS